MILWCILACAAGFIFGMLVTALANRSYTAFGTLRIDRFNPEKDVYRFDIDGDIVKLPKKKRIVLSIDPNADLSQE